MGPLADIRGGDIARNGFEKVDGSLAKMRDELRCRHGLTFALGMRRGHQVGRNDEAQRFRANARPIRDDEIAKAEQRFIFLPHGDVEEGIRADDEENAIAGKRVTKVADGVHRIVKLRAGKIFARLGERRNEVRMIDARERNHGETMRKRREVLLQLVRRAAGRDEMNFVEIEAAVCGTGYGKMAIVNRIEGAAKNRDAAGMMFSGSAVRLRGGQCVSNRGSKIILA